ncbi:MAG: MoxR family ATPase [Candidatus Wallbacteria bacterium]|nr:MoxR family ATPase [Candidatus Wallbacteria bacterium]
MQPDISYLNEMVKKEQVPLLSVISEVGRVIVGKQELLERMMIALVCDGHLLVEGVPGLAKTLAISSLSQALSFTFQRIQFTPDLLPADITGTMIYHQQKGEFIPKKGPVFHNLILADEINRAPAKVQSALLESMQERQVTLGDNTYPLPKPFLVMATQNPIEQEGTYPLPEAQVDRFMLKVLVGYPTKKEEKEIIARMSGWNPPEIKKISGPDDILKIRKVVDGIYIDDKVVDYITDLVFATRKPEDYGLKLKGMIRYGASPRASIYLTRGAKATAFMRGRGFVTPDDIRQIGVDVLRHRIILSYEAEAEGLTPDNVIKMIYDKVEVP